ncbi:S41 family peptidase [Lentzea sp. BCCO 10_0856]|uniref:S41 family peptidase n=1 Tax=Lentzea miocenica TaxID=3095431 RepID=A0ABU4SXW8_9PSEU|nr:S41 family peptidase [Lentzea sp. BCCO 10_0856]MDX8030735.1 S41 family peptidase [Lentzea sp. BCCO 10_0856]
MTATAHPNVANSVGLAEFLATSGTLTLAQRKLIVDQALVLLEQNYAHLPLKVAMHAVNPVQRLRVLRARLERQTDATADPEWQFHRDLSSTFHSVRDLHTNYLLPAPYAGKIAFLPFQLERCFAEDGTEEYLVTRTVANFSGLAAGTVVTHWNGIPIARAVALNGAIFAGSNTAANLARGLESLTLRPLVIQLPPDEAWVVVTYRGAAGAEEIRVDWQVIDNLPPMTDVDSLSPAAAAQGVDLDSDEKARAKKLLHAPNVVQAEATGGAVAMAAQDVPTTMPGVFRARPVTTPSGEFGHLRIFTFSVDDPEAFLAEFIRLAALLPQNGLIVDVRDNGGGHIFASEFLLQTMTPRRVDPEPVQFLSTPLNLRICRRHADDPTGQIDLGPWFPSLDSSTETGQAFSCAHTITPVDGANAVGQTYHGPVLLITDARCYSATDIFAAGWADHELGPILGVDDNTGAGGANVWTHGLLMTLLKIPGPGDTESPYKTLPGKANMRVSIRRTLRVGKLSGTPVEDLGVRPTHQHRVTRADLLQGNVDLLAKAGSLLAAMPVRRLGVAVDGTTVSLDTVNLDRVDVYVDGRPVTSQDVTDGAHVVTLAAAGREVRVEGFAEGQLVAARKVIS